MSACKVDAVWGMNHHPGKNLSICLFTSCSHREFRPIQKFDVQNNKVVAIGNLTGQVTGAIVGTVQNLLVTIPVIDANADACEILHLELGPIDLNLLGLVVHVDRIVIDISAQPGPGQPARQSALRDCRTARPAWCTVGYHCRPA